MNEQIYTFFHLFYFRKMFNSNAYILFYVFPTILRFLFEFYLIQLLFTIKTSSVWQYYICIWWILFLPLYSYYHAFHSFPFNCSFNIAAEWFFNWTKNFEQKQDKIYFYVRWLFVLNSLPSKRWNSSRKKNGEKIPFKQIFNVYYRFCLFVAVAGGGGYRYMCIHICVTMLSLQPMQSLISLMAFSKENGTKEIRTLWIPNRMQHNCEQNMLRTCAYICRKWK